MPTSRLATVRLPISERRILLMTMDAASVLVSLVGSLYVWQWVGGRQISLDMVQSQLTWMIPLGLGWLLWLALSDVYNLRLAVNASAITSRLLAGGVAVTFLYLLVFFVSSRAPVTQGVPIILGQFSQSGEPIRFAPAVAILSSTTLLVIGRWLYVLLLCGPQTRPRLLILGAGQAGRSLYSTIAIHHSSHYQMIGFIDDDPRKQSIPIANLTVLGNHRQLEQIAATYHVDEIALAISKRLPDDMVQILMNCHEQGIRITPMPLVYERLTGKVAVEHVGTQWYVALPLQPRPAATAMRFLKRLIDLVGSSILGLLLLLLLPLIALAIRIDSAGPIFYQQERLGWRGRSFRVIKFRSMVDDAEWDGVPRLASSDDPRVTRVGYWLRRTRLDELPQILNVLRGEMSLVGPRPERQEFVDHLQRLIPFFRARLAAKPGLTGWAQINYGYGSNTADSLAKLQYDLYYLKHQSPWFDLLILIRTITVVLRMRGR